MRKALILALIIANLLVAKVHAQAKKFDLLKSSWELSYIKSTETDWMTSYPLERKIILTFNDSLPLVNLKLCCNNGRGPYKYSAATDSIKFRIYSTLLLCPDPEMTWDEKICNSLNDAYKCELKGGELIFYSNGEYNLYFKEYKLYSPLE